MSRLGIRKDAMGQLRKFLILLCAHLSERETMKFAQNPAYKCGVLLYANKFKQYTK